MSEAKIFKGLCDANRIEILLLLKNGPLCACEILESLELAQSTLSHHMKVLSDSGLIETKKDGKWIYYSVNNELLDQAQDILENLKADSNKLKKCK